MGPRIVRWYRWSVVYVFVCQVDQVTGRGSYVFVNITVLWGKKGIRRQTAADSLFTPKEQGPNGSFCGNGSHFDPKEQLCSLQSQ